MPRQAARPRVPRINLDVVKRAFRNQPGKGESDYYILEKYDGPCLRVRRRVVLIGVRFRSRFHCAAHLRPDMTLEEVEAAAAESEVERLQRRADRVKPRHLEEARERVADTRALAKIAHDQVLIAGGNRIAGLDQDTGGGRADCRLQGLQVVEGHLREAGHGGAEALEIFLLSAGSDSGKGAAMEGALKGDQAKAPRRAFRGVVLARHLDRAFEGFGARIREEDGVGEGGLDAGKYEQPTDEKGLWKPGVLFLGIGNEPVRTGCFCLLDECLLYLVESFARFNIFPENPVNSSRYGHIGTYCFIDQEDALAGIITFGHHIHFQQGRLNRISLPNHITESPVSTE